MFDKNRVTRLYDANDALIAVQIPIDLWRLIEQKLTPPTPVEPEPETAPGEFERFLAAWDYRYPYDPAVECPVCGAESADWRADPEKPFALKTASLGGTLIFVCNACGANVRHKYFRYNCEKDAIPARPGD